MILVKDKLKKAGKTTSDYLSYLEDDRRNLDLSHLSGDLIEIDANHGSAKNMKIHPDLMDNFNKFLKE